MFIHRNDTLIKRNARIGQVTMFVALAVLAGGMFVSFQYPERSNWSFLALLLGFILSQVGIYFSNRFSRKPRPDELLDQALKGLDKRYALYHYITPATHLLVGPSGVWVLLPYYQRGTITYTKGRWRQYGGGILYQYLKLFAQEGLGRPDMELANQVSALQSLLQKHLPEESLPPIQAALVFTHPKVEISIPEGETPPAETVKLKDLKDLIRKSGKAKTISLDKVKLIQDVLLSRN
jgi:hypothetical protein